MKLGIYGKVSFLFFALFLASAGSCTTVKVGVELLLRPFDGKTLLENEAQVKKRLERILLTPEKYTMTGYTRQALSPEVKRTAKLYHSFYAVSSGETAFFILSFSGTKKRLYSEGVWAINTESDIKSYISFKFGSNEWDVQAIPVSKGINTEMTIKNILAKIDNNTNYYYNDHNIDKKGLENCNTALRDTLAENG